MRRIFTGHGAAGKAMFIEDGDCVAQNRSDQPGVMAAVMVGATRAG